MSSLVIHSTEKDKESQDFDVCMVFPVPPAAVTDGVIKSITDYKFSPEAISILDKIYEKLGEENMYAYLSVQNDEIYVLLSITETLMKYYADLNDLLLLADEDALKARSALGWPGTDIKPIKIEHDPTITPFTPYEYIYLPYHQLKHGEQFAEETEQLYSTASTAVNLRLTVNPLTPRKAHQESSKFNQRDRISILKHIIEDHHHLGGLNIPIYKLEHKVTQNAKRPILLAFFPVHTNSALKALKNIQVCDAHEYWLPFNQPLDALRSYFGEKIALYYAFTGHFLLCLTGPALVGLGFEVVVIMYRAINHPIIPFFSIFICLWGVFLMEFWKRKEKRIAMKHGMIGYELTASLRPEFIYEKKVFITGHEELYYPPKKRLIRFILSFTLIFFFISCVIGTTAGIYSFRNYLAGLNKSANDGSAIIASVLNAVQVQAYGFLYSKLSASLTDLENHRTDLGYDDSMIAKDFAFYFINAFSSFFFLAFLAGNIASPNYPGQPADDPKRRNQGMCSYSTCMEALALNLGIILGSNIIVSNLVQVIVPFICYQKKLRDETRGDDGRVMSAAEVEYCKTEYDRKALISDYMQVAILFGYMTLFITALPGAATAVFISTSIGVGADRFKLINLYRRPWPEGAEDIGTWQSIFELLITAAVVTNAGLIVFTMELINGYSLFTRFFIFIGYQWILFAFQFGIRFLVPDVPLDVIYQCERQEMYKAKLIDRTADDDDFGEQ